MVCEQARIGKELRALINQVQIEALKKGKKSPSVKQITDRIAKKIKQEDILFNEIIHF